MSDTYEGHGASSTATRVAAVLCRQLGAFGHMDIVRQRVDFGMGICVLDCARVRTCWSGVRVLVLLPTATATVTTTAIYCKPCAHSLMVGDIL